MGESVPPGLRAKLELEARQHGVEGAVISPLAVVIASLV